MKLTVIGPILLSVLFSGTFAFADGVLETYRLMDSKTIAETENHKPFQNQQEIDKANQLCKERLQTEASTYESQCTGQFGQVILRASSRNNLLGALTQCSISCVVPDVVIGKCKIQTVRDSLSAVRKVVLLKPNGNVFSEYMAVPAGASETGAIAKLVSTAQTVTSAECS